MSEIKQILYKYYNLELAIVGGIEFSYKSKIGNNGKSKLTVIEDSGDKYDRKIQNKKKQLCKLYLLHISY